jgi:hypothetical protein
MADIPACAFEFRATHQATAACKKEHQYKANCFFHARFSEFQPVSRVAPEPKQ